MNNIGGWSEINDPPDHVEYENGIVNGTISLSSTQPNCSDAFVHECGIGLLSLLGSQSFIVSHSPRSELRSDLAATARIW